jgi:hypothetical protein
VHRGDLIIERDIIERDIIERDIIERDIIERDAWGAARVCQVQRTGRLRRGAGGCAWRWEKSEPAARRGKVYHLMKHAAPRLRHG